MARSLLGSFVSGTRQVLAAQLFVSVAAVGVAGWTMGVTNELIRERDALSERVIQLEEELAGRGIVPPAPVNVQEAANEPASGGPYPPSVGEPEQPADPERPTSEPTPGGSVRPGLADAVRAPETAVAADPNVQTQSPANDGVILRRQQAARENTFNPAQIFAAAPPIATLVLHVRAGEVDDRVAQLRDELARATNINVVVDEMERGDPRTPGYAYFDGRQSRAAAALVQQFNEAARRQEIAPWAVQLRGVALPAQGEYTTDRVDIVLPPRASRQQTIR